MVPEKQKNLINEVAKCLNELLLLGVDCSMNIDNKEAKLPDQDIETPLFNLLYSLVRPYKHDVDGLYKVYMKSHFWKLAIRKSFLMDDKDEKGYWYYHVYGIEPNKFLFLYMEEHFPIALEKILEMFERGYQEEFLRLNMDEKEIKGFKLFDHGIDEILNIIDERHRGNRLIEPKRVGHFLAWLYLLDKKKVEKILEEYESVVDEDLQTIVQSCRYSLAHRAKEQLSLEVV
ncbi:hypothetical protein IT402_01115 [Candidatus Nomurabacteria bacterium]|nr:hypothetical protein [Candidatus Nomurabacteria bacterium]